MSIKPQVDIDFKVNNPFAEQILKKGGTCKFCNGERVIKNGKKNGKQQWKCKDCGHQFINEGELVKVRVSKQVIATALDLYYEGLSLRKVARQIRKIFGVNIDHSTIWYWTQKYTPLVKDFTQSLTPQTRKGIWHVDETWIKRKKEEGFWYWDIIDRDTRFIVGTHLSKHRYIKDAASVFTDGKRQFHDRPKMVICDGLPAYYKGLKKAYGGMTVRDKIVFVQKAGISKKMPSNNNRIERYHNTIKDRTKIMRGMQNPLGILDGYTLHYNFIRTHMTLKTTPAHISGIHLPFENGWSDLIRWATYYKTLA